MANVQYRAYESDQSKLSPHNHACLTAKQGTAWMCLVYAYERKNTDNTVKMAVVKFTPGIESERFQADCQRQLKINIKMNTKSYFLGDSPSS